MKNIVDMPVEEMAGMTFDCACGKKHSFDIKKIVIGTDVLSSILDMAQPFLGKNVFMFSDNNTFAAAGEKVHSIMQDGGHQVKSFVLETGDDILIPDEKVLGRLFMEMEPHTALIVVAGSGTLNDLAKYMSARTGIPYIVVCTAPSMDGYASDGAPLICDGFKISYVGTLAYGILADVNVMKNAPDKLIHAGFGDVLGKYTALADWMLARDVVGEYYCETCVAMTHAVLKKVMENVEGIRAKEPEAIHHLTEALIMSGVAMGLIGVSRPASGAEHMLSHYWEMYFIAHGRYPELHGIKVGVATPVIAEFFDLMEDKIPKEVKEICPDREEMERLLKAAGAPVLPTEIGIERELFYESLLKAYTVRERYSILEFAIEQGRMEQCAQRITERIYGPEK